MRQWLVDWVDRDRDAAEDRFRPTRAMRLFVAILASKFSSAVPLLLLILGVSLYQQYGAKEDLRRKLEQSSRRTQQAIANEEDVGEATLLLYGIDPDEYERRRSSKAPSSTDPRPIPLSESQPEERPRPGAEPP
jgi:hypothetical protein